MARGEWWAAEGAARTMVLGTMRTVTVASRFTSLKPRQAPACGGSGLDSAALLARWLLSHQCLHGRCRHLRRKVDGGCAIREPDQGAHDLLGRVLPVGDGAKLVHQPLGVNPA